MEPSEITGALARELLGWAQDALAEGQRTKASRIYRVAQRKERRHREYLAWYDRMRAMQHFG